MPKRSNSIIRVAITTGDPDGIGSEVACKALAKLGPMADVQFVLWRSPKCPPNHLKFLKRKFKVVTVNSLSEISDQPLGSKLIDVSSPLPSVEWVVQSAQECLAGRFNAMATAPMSKTSIQAAGYSQIGHTEILAKIANTSELTMGFWGRQTAVVLLTGHIPLSAVSARLTRKTIEVGVERALKVRALLPPTRRKKPIAIVGLNPHAGEGGIIGKEEVRLLEPLVEQLQRSGIPIRGPLVPDAAFLPANRALYSVYLCPYHDQGLIAFKLIHGFDEGVHITLGLPFVRTSVDHGTAKELFRKNKAKYGSMLEAIKVAVQMARATKES